jgi:hypothetical protein
MMSAPIGDLCEFTLPNTCGKSLSLVYAIYGTSAVSKVHASKQLDAEINNETLMKILPISPTRYCIIRAVEGVVNAAMSSCLNKPNGSIDRQVIAVKVVSNPNTVAIPTVCLVLA